MGSSAPLYYGPGRGTSPVRPAFSSIFNVLFIEIKRQTGNFGLY
ncbi:hypothetical protein HMPREF0239_01872 [Clostridium sp. ATCC BAA-442]|uniref:Uncharacterized protein n=1 Tax=Flavonifractor plautii ATCC 29863 TaxID=411475 RepID=G9YPC8_FLAPL|nr:hypothetical protein HMPREF0372_01367 [Flavonifractor plautii ATCC 29863]ERI77142.1 hypothetical protein HMPREF0239_01872 [Clostridium sp. ATCC BAA-442]